MKPLLVRQIYMQLWDLMNHEARRKIRAKYNGKAEVREARHQRYLASKKGKL